MAGPALADRADPRGRNVLAAQVPNDPLQSILDQGAILTNALRTDADTERLRRQGYTPATNSLHLAGDAVDLTPGQTGWSLKELAARARKAFGSSYSIGIHNGTHVHIQKPGWGGGLPATPEGFNFAAVDVEGDGEDLPPPPEGFATPPPPSGFADPDAPPSTAEDPAPAPLVEGSSAGIAFTDELPPEVQSKLRPDQVAAWHALVRDPKSTPEQLQALMAGFGFDLANADAIVKARSDGLGVREDFDYRRPEPRDTGTGRGGAMARAGANTLTGNFAAEIQALGRTARDYIDGSLPDGTSFGEQLARNVDYFEAPYEFDRETYPVTTFGTELGAGMLIPFGAAARTPGQLAKVGAAYGAVYGAGDGTGGPLERLPNAAAGTALGAGGGYGIGKTIDLLARPVRRGFDSVRDRIGKLRSDIPLGAAREAAYEAAPIVQDGVQGAPGARPGTAQDAVDTAHDTAFARDESLASMSAKFDDPTLTAVRAREGGADVPDALPPPPPGFVDHMPMGASRLMSQPRSAAEIAAVAQRVSPDDVTPMPSNTVESFDEFRRMTEGRPIAGDAIGVEDLKANEPPATAYEDLTGLDGKVGNINVANLETRGDIRRALKNTEAMVGGFDAARRGTISHSETQALASELGMTPDDLLRRRQGQALNAEEALAARRILAKSADELVELASKVKGGSDEELAAFRKAWIRHVAIQEQVSGATSEAGRALAQFKIMAKAKDARVRVLQGVIEGSGGRDRLEDVADKIIDLQKDPTKLNSFARLASKPGWKDKLVELWYNWLLSGPQTHVVNMMSNTLTSLGQLPEHALAAGLGSVRYKATKANADRVLFSEIGARASGWVQGLQEGLGQGLRTFRTGEASDFVSKVEQHSAKAISGRKGEVIRIPTRLLSAEDELFKAMARRMEIAGLSVRQAAKEADALKGMGPSEKAEWRKRRAAELTANPTDEIMEKAFNYGRYVTFQKPLGPVGSSILRITNEMPILKLVLPFVRTPTNIFKFALERSPAAPVLREWREDFKAGGARRDLAVARAMIGSAVGALVGQWAAEGRITGGGPADENALRLLRADGWQPYSIRIGDKYYSYQRMDPFASTFGVAADFASKAEYLTEKQRKHVATLMVASLMNQMQSKTWLSGLADLVEAVNDPDRFARSYVARLAGSLAVPAGVAQMARVEDPILRDAKGPLDRIKSRVPGLSDTLAPRMNIWGQPITSEGGLGPDAVSPIWVGTRKNDPVTKEMLAIGARIGPAQKTVAGRELSSFEYAEYSALSGRRMYEDLADAIASPSWQDMTNDERVEEVDLIKNAARAEAREAMGLVGE